MTVVDASVVVKWFVEEPGSALARNILADEERLYAPGHLMAEVGRGLLRRKRAEDRSPQDAKLALAGLVVMVHLFPGEAVIERAFDIADVHFVAIYDALYAALAEQTADLLVTADRRLCDGLRSTGWPGRVQHLSERPTLLDR